MPLLETALAAAKNLGIPRENIFLLSVPGAKEDSSFPNLDQLISEGASLPPVQKLKWIKGQGKRQPAFLSFSSGTSGLPVRYIRPNTILYASQS